MSLARIALAACGITLALATTASAQALAPDLQDRMAFFLNPTGQVTTMRLNDTGHGMAMRYGKPLPARTMVYRSGNRFWMIPDRKMANGTMMFDGIEAWGAHLY
jgi:hypothetical protein